MMDGRHQSDVGIILVPPEAWAQIAGATLRAREWDAKAAGHTKQALAKVEG